MQNKAIIILAGGFRKNRKGRWQSGGFSGPVFGSNLSVLAGSYLFKKDPAQIIIASGGRGYLKKYKDAPRCSDIMRKELQVLGIPGHKIIEEKKSNNTYQQLKELNQLLKKLKINNVIIVSNRYHLPRVKTMLKYLFEFKLADQIQFVPAEKVVTEYRPGLKYKIEKLYQSEKVKKMIQREREGIKQIKSGEYDTRKNTSYSDRLIRENNG